MFPGGRKNPINHFLGGTQIMKHGKKYLESAKLIERSKLYDQKEALELAVKAASAKFDETLEVHIRLGVDSRHADQQVRGAVVLPNGTGRNVRVAVFAKGDMAKIAEILARTAEYLTDCDRENPTVASLIEEYMIFVNRYNYEVQRINSQFLDIYFGSLPSSAL
jgi:hypothetical protein